MKNYRNGELTSPRPQIKLPRNPYDAASVVAERIFEWNLEDHRRLLVTYGTDSDFRFLPKKPFEWIQTPRKSSLFEGQFHLLTYQPGHLEGDWLSLPWHTLDEYRQATLCRNQLAYLLWSIAEWDISEYPYYHDRGLFPTTVLSFLEDGKTFHCENLSIWNYILPAFKDEMEFQEWVSKYPRMPQYHTRTQNP